MPTNKIKSPAVWIELDKPRLLLIDFNAMAELHDATGRTVEEAFQFDKPVEERKPPSLLFMRDLVWAGLLSGSDEKEKPLTAKQVGCLIQDYGAGYVFGKLTEAFAAANEDPQAKPETDSPLEAAA